MCGCPCLVATEAVPLLLPFVAMQVKVLAVPVDKALRQVLVMYSSASHRGYSSGFTIRMPVCTR